MDRRQGTPCVARRGTLRGERADLPFLAGAPPRCRDARSRRPPRDARQHAQVAPAAALSPHPARTSSRLRATELLLPLAGEGWDAGRVTPPAGSPLPSRSPDEPAAPDLPRASAADVPCARARSARARHTRDPRLRAGSADA